MAEPFVELPSEVLDSFASYVADPSSLRSLALTCRRLQLITEPYIYRDVFLRTGPQAIALSDAIQKRVERIALIKTIKAPFDFHKNLSGMAQLAVVIRGANKLQHLHIESPYCNAERWLGPTGWTAIMGELLRPLLEASCLSKAPAPQTRPLQGLKSLVLHLNGEPTEFWNIKTHPYIFAHPNLEDLHISSTNFLDDAVLTIPKGLKTPLKRLTFDECNITNKALHDILSLPTALETLIIGESIHCEDDEPDVGSMCLEPELFFAALNQQHHSLQRLSYEPSAFELQTFGWIAPSFPTFEKFEKLTEFRLLAEHHFLTSIFHHRDHSPPNLTTLHLMSATVMTFPLEDRRDKPDVLIPWLEKLLPQQKHLKSLIITYEEESYWGRPYPGEERRTESAARLLGERGIDFQVFQMPVDVTTVPPVLYGETPQQKFLLCSTTQGWIGMPKEPPIYAFNDDEFDDDEFDDDEFDDESEEDDEEWEDMSDAEYLETLGYNN